MPRKAQKCGVVIEESCGANYSPTNTDEQLAGCVRQKKVWPNYSRDLARFVHSSFASHRSALLLRARDPDGKCIATGACRQVRTNSLARFLGNCQFTFRSIISGRIRPSRQMARDTLLARPWHGNFRLGWRGHLQRKIWRPQRVLVHIFCNLPYQNSADVRASRLLDYSCASNALRAWLSKRKKASAITGIDV